ncbi:hypothetical protein OUZ56_025546 [Daphnia magna]|uniref:Uncharacterized protein n=1 Tax=Daphnia magna TaxID=35525 RepID=A0ABQ9ZK51_9CRUS|nr:hypothetical protein OUZ56_025546 [Daphnia magna]
MVAALFGTQPQWRMMLLLPNATHEAVARVDTTSFRKSTSVATEVRVGHQENAHPPFMLGLLQLSPKETPSTTSISSTFLCFSQKNQEYSRSDFTNLDEQAPIPCACDQEPESDHPKMGPATLVEAETCLPTTMNMYYLAEAKGVQNE